MSADILQGRRGSIVNVVDEAGSSVVSYTYTDYGKTSETQETEEAEFETSSGIRAVCMTKPADFII